MDNDITENFATVERLIAQIGGLASKCSINRHQARRLTKKCKTFFATIKSGVESFKRPPEPFLKTFYSLINMSANTDDDMDDIDDDTTYSYIKRLLSKFIFVLNDIQRALMLWNCFSYWKLLAHQGEITKAISTYERTLSDMKNGFEARMDPDYELFYEHPPITHESLGISSGLDESADRVGEVNCSSSLEEQLMRSNFGSHQDESRNSKAFKLNGTDGEEELAMWQLIDDFDDRLNDEQKLGQNSHTVCEAPADANIPLNPQSSPHGRLTCIFESLGELNLEGDIVDFEQIKFGFGASSDVYRARSKRHKRKVAIKCIRVFMFLEDDSFAKALGREVRLWSRLDHPNVLPLLGFFLEGPNVIPNLVSEWMEKGTVTAYLRGRPFVVSEICKMIAGIASGIAYLHDEQSIVHSDLKGSNILVSDNGEPLLADFGLSISSTSLSLLGTTNHGGKGSLRWMAKELHLSDNNAGHNFRTDIWSFGMVICEILTRNVPYPSIRNNRRIPEVILQGALPEEPDFSHLAYNEVYREIWSICRTCWRGAPLERPSAKDVLTKLNKLMSSIRVEVSS